MDKLSVKGNISSRFRKEEYTLRRLFIILVNAVAAVILGASFNKLIMKCDHSPGSK